MVAIAQSILLTLDPSRFVDPVSFSEALGVAQTLDPAELAGIADAYQDLKHPSSDKLRALLSQLPAGDTGQIRRRFADVVGETRADDWVQVGWRTLQKLHGPSAGFFEVSPDFKLRDFQLEYILATLRAIRTGRDRGYLIAPWQVGKSFVIAPLADLSLGFFPGKQILAISPYKTITSQTREDLIGGFGGTIGVVDQQHKEFDRDAVVASAMTLKNCLDRLDPGKIGLVVVDEMTFSLAPTWQKILRRLGFLDDRGRPKANPGKFLLGLGATGERRDGRHVREVFGNTLLSARGFNWFVNRGYLHEPYGLEEPYGQSRADSEAIRERSETVVVMRDTKENRAHLIATYEKYLSGKKALVFTARVREAENLAKDFNRRYGEGYAAVISNETPDWLAEKWIDNFNAGRGLKVLLSVRKLSIGARFEGVAGVIFNYQSDSWNYFAQSAGRGLARLLGESLRHVLVIVMEGHVKPLNNPQSVATMMGYRGDTPKGKVYDPSRLREKQKRQVGVRRHRKTGWAKFGSMLRAADLNVKTDAFAQTVERIMNDRFDGDLVTMAERSGYSTAELDSYQSGILPESFSAVLRMAKALGVFPDVLTEAWLKDMAFLTHAAFPLPAGMPEAQRELTLLIRLAILRTAKEGTLISVVGGDKSEHHRVAKGFKGNLPVQADPLRFYYDLIVHSGAAEEEEAKHAILRYLLERNPSAKMSGDSPFALDDIFERGERGELEGENPTPAELLEIKQMAEAARRAIGTLTPREERVLMLRFGLGGVGKHTLEEVAEKPELLVSRNRIMQIEAKAMRKLRHPARANSLKEALCGIRMQWGPPKFSEKFRWKADLSIAGSYLMELEKIFLGHHYGFGWTMDQKIAVAKKDLEPFSELFTAMIFLSHEKTELVRLEERLFIHGHFLRGVYTVASLWRIVHQLFASALADPSSIKLWAAEAGKLAEYLRRVAVPVKDWVNPPTRSQAPREG